MDAFQAASDKYQQEIETYKKQISDWEGGRARAFGSSENLLGRWHELYAPTFDANVPVRWLYQMFLTFLLFVVILVLQKRKDVI